MLVYYWGYTGLVGYKGYAGVVMYLKVILGSKLYRINTPLRVVFNQRYTGVVKFMLCNLVLDLLFSSYYVNQQFI